MKAIIKEIFYGNRGNHGECKAGEEYLKFLEKAVNFYNLIKELYF